MTVPPVHLGISELLTVMEGIAIFAYAISGLIEARQHKLDIVGAFVVAFLTAFGGGTLRDLLLERRPFYWVEHQNYVLAMFVLSLFAPFILKSMTGTITRRVLLIADAIGLGLFSISGTSLAIAMDLPMFTSVMMGVTTGVFGGILRDVLCNEVPMILRDSRPYATCAFVGCWAYIALVSSGVAADASAALAAGLILAARLVTYRFRIMLPH